MNKEKQIRPQPKRFFSQDTVTFLLNIWGQFWSVHVTGAVPALAGGFSEQNKHWWDRGLCLWPLRNIQQGAMISTHSARWTCRCLVGIHVYLFMSVTSFAFLVIFRVPHIKKIAHQLNRVFIFLLFRYLLILGSLSPAIMMPRCLFPPYEYCWMTIIECLQWSSWYSSISHYIWSRLHRTPLAEKFRQVFFDGLPKTRLSKKKDPLICENPPCRLGWIRT